MSDDIVARIRDAFGHDTFWDTDAPPLLEDAVAEIERLRAGWIPVSERLPADRSRVLVAMMGVVWPATYRPDTKKKFVLDGSDKFQRINFFSSISHWMPFPEPPRWPPR